MTGAEEPEHFVLLRFDAMENRVATMAVPAQLAVPGTGGQQSLLQAVQSAGPVSYTHLDVYKRQGLRLRQHAV